MSDELIYAETATCPCGAKLAYRSDQGADGHWDCSDILLGKAIPEGELGVKKHTDQLPFRFWKIKEAKKGA